MAPAVPSAISFTCTTWWAVRRNAIHFPTKVTAVIAAFSAPGSPSTPSTGTGLYNTQGFFLSFFLFCYICNLDTGHCICVTYMQLLPMCVWLITEFLFSENNKWIALMQTSHIWCYEMRYVQPLFIFISALRFAVLPCANGIIVQLLRIVVISSFRHWHSSCCFIVWLFVFLAFSP